MCNMAWQTVVSGSVYASLGLKENSHIPSALLHLLAWMLWASVTLPQTHSLSAHTLIILCFTRLLDYSLS